MGTDGLRSEPMTWKIRGRTSGEGATREGFEQA
jgi:hypothetical protein